MRHLAIVLLETVLRRTPNVVVDPQTKALLDPLRGKAVLALTGHVGNWEYLARFGTRDGYRLSVIARPARIKALQRILELVRGDLDVIWRSGPTLKIAADALRSKRWLGALVDQDLEARGVRVDGFGLRAHTPSSLVELALKCDAEIISAFLLRQPDGTYHLAVRKLTGGDGASGVLTAFQAHMWEVIGRHPEQWVWFHKRWRTTNHERISGKKYVGYIRSILPLGNPFLIVQPTRILPSEKG